MITELRDPRHRTQSQAGGGGGEVFEVRGPDSWRRRSPRGPSLGPRPRRRGEDLSAERHVSLRDAPRRGPPSLAALSLSAPGVSRTSRAWRKDRSEGGARPEQRRGASDWQEAGGGGCERWGRRLHADVGQWSFCTCLIGGERAGEGLQQG